MRPSLYLIFIVSEFIRPQYPGYLPLTPNGFTGETTRNILQQHKVNKAQSDISRDCDDVLRQKILAAFKNDYVEGAANENVGFARTTTLEILNHI